MQTGFKNFKKADWAIIAGGIVILLILILTTLGVNKFLSKSYITMVRAKV